MPVIEAYDTRRGFLSWQKGVITGNVLDLANKIRQTVNRKRAEKALRESGRAVPESRRAEHDASTSIRDKIWSLSTTGSRKYPVIQRKTSMARTILDLFIPMTGNVVAEILT